MSQKATSRLREDRETWTHLPDP